MIADGGEAAVAVVDQAPGPFFNGKGGDVIGVAGDVEKAPARRFGRIPLDRTQGGRLAGREGHAELLQGYVEPAALGLDEGFLARPARVEGSQALGLGERLEFVGLGGREELPGDVRHRLYQKLDLNEYLTD